MTPTDLADVPETLREKLKESLILLDEDPIREAIDQIEEWNNGLGKKLRYYAENLEYAKIFQALESNSPP